METPSANEVIRTTTAEMMPMISRTSATKMRIISKKITSGGAM